MYAQPYILHDSKAKLRLETFDNQTDRIVRPRSLATPVEIFVRNFLADATSETSSACGHSCREPDECIDSKCIPSPTSYVVVFENIIYKYEDSHPKTKITGTSTLHWIPHSTRLTMPSTKLQVKVQHTQNRTFVFECEIYFFLISQIECFTPRTYRYWSGVYGPTLGVRIYLSDQGTFEWVTFVFGVLFFASCFYVSTRIQREMLKRKVL